MKDKKVTKIYKSSSESVYGLGFIGALFYHIQAAESFWAGILGLFKAILWPAFLVYEVLRYLGG